MSIWQGLLRKLGLGERAEPTHLSVFLLDDDRLRHDWFARRFSNDQIDIAVDPAGALELLSTNYYDAIFLDHDLLPEHYGAQEHDDERTGYAVAAWLAARPDLQPSALVIVHTRNADGAMRMVEMLRGAGRQAEYVPFPVLSQKIRSYLRR
ncbi:MAG: Cyclic-phosphate processing Receiver domain [Acidobacteriota bacterium]|nr:Cyclic-phosphate processing Receiver domain [Acidobacteriota bacterium]